MSRSRDDVVFLSDFTGGLNLTTQQQTLRESESPDAVNVDFGLRGGFVTRGGFRSVAKDDALLGARFMGTTYFADDVVLIQGGDGELYQFDGALVATNEELTDEDKRVRMAVFNRKAYFANGYDTGVIAMRSWDGTTLATLANAFNDDYTLPTAGNMPKARHVVEHMGHMWVADTVEGSTRFPHRVRFSHTQFPEDWAADDYFDVDPHDDGDPITGLFPFREMLLVFKRSSVWAVFGYDRDSFVLERVTNASGTCTCGAIAANSGVCYWFSTSGSLMAFNGREVTSLSQPIRWWSELGRIASGGAHRLMWASERLWLSLQAGQGENVSRWLFVWDPEVKAFTRYDRLVSDLQSYEAIGQPSQALFLYQGVDQLYRYDRAFSTDTNKEFLYIAITDADGDPLLYDQADPEKIILVKAGQQDIVRPVRGVYRTAWMKAGETATRKRFKRPRITSATEGSCTIHVRVFHDFNESVPVREYSFRIDSASDTSLWDTVDWDDAVWALPEEAYDFRRLPSAGSAYAVQLEFSSNDNDSRWWIDSIAIPLRRKRIR